MIGKLTKPNIRVESLVDSSNSFYQDLLGYKPEKTFLKQVSENQWNKFTTQRGLNPDSSGIYLPRNQTAVISGDNPLSLFHEYFGHGLYCEQSLSGRKLIDLEKRVLEEEKQEFFSRKFTLEDIQKFRQRNSTFQKLEEFRKQNLTQYETFAIWTEYLLSGEFGLKDEFGRKYDSLENRDKEAIDSIIGFSEQHGNLATFYASGLARKITPERVKRLLEDVYGNEVVNNSKLILLTGSKKLFSDIDLFASSDYLQPNKNNWLDLVVFDEKDFEKKVRLFEVQVTHPIMAGELVAGDKDYFQQKRKQLQEQPITEEAIQHNLTRSRINEEFALKCEPDSEDQQVSISYSMHFIANAKALSAGERIFGRDKLEKSKYYKLVPFSQTRR